MSPVWGNVFHRRALLSRNPNQALLELVDSWHLFSARQRLKVFVDAQAHEKRISVLKHDNVNISPTCLSSFYMTRISGRELNNCAKLPCCSASETVRGLQASHPIIDLRSNPRLHPPGAHPARPTELRRLTPLWDRGPRLAGDAATGT